MKCTNQIKRQFKCSNWKQNLKTDPWSTLKHCAKNNLLQYHFNLNKYRRTYLEKKILGGTTLFHWNEILSKSIKINPKESNLFILGLLFYHTASIFSTKHILAIADIYIDIIIKNMYIRMKPLCKLWILN